MYSVFCVCQITFDECSIFAVVPSDSAGLLQFEVCPLTDSSFSVSFQHPVNESLVCGEYSLLQNLNNQDILDYISISLSDSDTAM